MDGTHRLHQVDSMPDIPWRTGLPSRSESTWHRNARSRRSPLVASLPVRLSSACLPGSVIEVPARLWSTRFLWSYCTSLVSLCIQVCRPHTRVSRRRGDNRSNPDTVMPGHTWCPRCSSEGPPPHCTSDSTTSTCPATWTSSPSGSTAATHEIGRASCRERV